MRAAPALSLALLVGSVASFSSWQCPKPLREVCQLIDKLGNGVHDAACIVKNCRAQMEACAKDSACIGGQKAYFACTLSQIGKKHRPAILPCCLPDMRQTATGTALTLW